MENRIIDKLKFLWEPQSSQEKLSARLDYFQKQFLIVKVNYVNKLLRGELFYDEKRQLEERQLFRELDDLFAQPKPRCTTEQEQHEWQQTVIGIFEEKQTNLVQLTEKQDIIIEFVNECQQEIKKFSSIRKTPHGKDTIIDSYTHSVYALAFYFGSALIKNKTNFRFGVNRSIALGIEIDHILSRCYLNFSSRLNYIHNELLQRASDCKKGDDNLWPNKIPENRISKIIYCMEYAFTLIFMYEKSISQNQLNYGKVKFERLASETFITTLHFALMNRFFEHPEQQAQFKALYDNYLKWKSLQPVALPSSFDQPDFDETEESKSLTIFLPIEDEEALNKARYVLAQALKLCYEGILLIINTIPTYEQSDKKAWAALIANDSGVFSHKKEAATLLPQQFGENIYYDQFILEHFNRMSKWINLWLSFSHEPMAGPAPVNPNFVTNEMEMQHTATLHSPLLSELINDYIDNKDTFARTKASFEEGIFYLNDSMDMYERTQMHIYTYKACQQKIPTFDIKKLIQEYCLNDAEKNKILAAMEEKELSNEEIMQLVRQSRDVRHDDEKDNNDDNDELFHRLSL